MDREALVYVDLEGVPHLMGRLWARARKNKESATFEYDEAWLQHPARFSLEPALQLGPGPFHTPAETPMFGAIGDSAPDRWGRMLMRRMERRRAEREGGVPRTLQEIDCLLLVDDEARQCALRFAEREGGPFLPEEDVKRIPPLVELPQLLSAAEHVMEDKDTEEDLRLLFAPGSSLGGARPKASVIEKDGHLAIAKFPRKDDEINTVVWEAVALALAKKAGTAVPTFRVELIAKKPVLLLRRFDREGARRTPFLSAMSMLGSKDNEMRSYLEIVDALRQHGAALSTTTIAINKAFTSRAFDIDTKTLATLSQPDDDFFGIQDSNHGRVMIFAGGIPLKKNGKVVGAIGVSGGKGKQDQAVAEAGAAAF